MGNKDNGEITGVITKPQFDTNLMYVGRVVTVKYCGGGDRNNITLPYGKSVTGLIAYTSPFEIELISITSEDEEYRFGKDDSSKSNQGLRGTTKEYSISVDNVINGTIKIENIL